MIITNEYNFFITSLFDASEELPISEKEFYDLTTKFRSCLQREWGSTYTKYWILDNGKKTDHYLVKRLVGIKEIY